MTGHAPGGPREQEPRMEEGEMQKAAVNGVELAYEVTGSGEPVLLISTGPIADSFRPFLGEPALAERYRLVTYRQQGQGDGTQSPAPVSFAAHAADAAELLRHLGVGRAHVVGHSTGAAIALQLAFDRPEIVHTLTLLEPTLLSVPGAGAFLEKAGPALAAYGSGDREAAMAGFVSRVSGLEWETCRAVIEDHVPGGVSQAIEDADTFFGSYLPSLQTWAFGAPQAAGISQPVLSVLGTESDRWFVECHDLLHSWFPQIEDCVVEGVGHLLQMQRPEPVAEGIAEFLGRHPMVEAEGGDRQHRAAATPSARGVRSS